MDAAAALRGPGQPQQITVLFVATLFKHLAAFHLPFMQQLIAAGYRVHAAASSDGGRVNEVQDIGTECWNIPFKRSPYHPGNVAAAVALNRLLNEHHYDLVHTHTPVSSFLARYLSKRTHQGPVLYTAHGLHFYEGAPLRSWLLYRTAELAARQWTDALMVINSEDLKHAEKLGYREGVDLFRIHGVGVDLSRYCPGNWEIDLRDELSLSQQTPLVCCIAEFTPNKNHAMLLDAWPIVAAHFPDAQLLLVGSAGRRAAVEQRVRELGLPRVHFLGHRDDVPDLLRQIDVLVLVSRREGLPRVIIEAMATGIPVVASSIRGNRDLVQPGINGWLVHPDNPQGCAAALMECLGNPTQSRRLGENGRRLVEPYSLCHVSKELNQIYARFQVVVPDLVPHTPSDPEVVEPGVTGPDPEPRA